MSSLLDRAAGASAGPPSPPAAVRTTGSSRGVVSVLVLLVLLALVALASLMWGARDISAAQVWAGLFSPVAGDNDHSVVRDLRVPRTLVGLVGGAALGAAGALLQGVTRNPIADPGLLGINAGASLAVVTAISALGVSSVAGYLWFGFAGAAIAAVVVYGAASLGWEGVTPIKLALVGAAFTATATSLSSVVLLTDRRTLGEYRFWQVGSLANRPLDVLVAVLPFVAVGLLLALASGRVLNALALGDDVARGLGQDVARGRLLVVTAVVLLCGSAVALVGPIAFIGLVVPHLARVLVGPDYRWLVALSALLGPVLLLAADVVGRLVVRPGELEAGLVVAVLGAPVLIAVVRRSRTVAA
ncbi:iron ABC transporter permease [Nocardioides sp. zg-DK7169]|uniref:FecCD family ABC transporter permease n=1 Tax=Nocardioides sp. zg-DK7169 TaxID=2736600 RepID=UPI001557208D|nr:iron ABC transporter permease [Nocardioides sp. zg-DK7169]NPC95621.1 iron ABC transporter permease [Nocardioides sp. zg-DK7169]